MKNSSAQAEVKIMREARGLLIALAVGFLAVVMTGFVWRMINE